jgi:3-hydroxybutyryl-CoA dehydrogenase
MAGHLGRKSGRGYYSYDASPPVAALPDPGFGSGQPRSIARVVGVVGGVKSVVLAALGETSVVPVEEIGDADVVVVDGGSRSATSEHVARVAAVAKPGAVIAAATTDEAPVGTLSVGTGRSADVVGLHLPLTPKPGLIEVVATLHSSPDAVATAVAMVRAAGLVAVPCRDRPGHVIDMILLPHLGDAARMVDDRYATVEDVEAAMTLGCGYPVGPFAMLDAIGADNLRSALLHLGAATHLPSLAPAPFLDELAANG